MLDKLNFKKLALLSVFTAIFSFNAKAEMSPELVNSIKKLDVEAVKANLSSNLSNNNSIKLEDKKQIEELLFKAEKDLKIKWAQKTLILGLVLYLAWNVFRLNFLIPLRIDNFLLKNENRVHSKSINDWVEVYIKPKEGTWVKANGEKVESNVYCQACYQNKSSNGIRIDPISTEVICKKDDFENEELVIYFKKISQEYFDGTDHFTERGAAVVYYRIPWININLWNSIFAVTALGSLAYFNKNIPTHIKNIFTFFKEDFDKIKKIRELVNKLEINEGL